jgi:UDP-GlcNAc:undecaprenyl-phosphate GlcNAc-1-phosphate transferase
MSRLVLAAALPSFIVAWLTGFLVRRWAPRWGLIDRPGHRKVHTQPTPLGGGLAIWLGVVVPLAVGSVALLVSSGPHSSGVSRGSSGVRSGAAAAGSANSPAVVSVGGATQQAVAADSGAAAAPDGAPGREGPHRRPDGRIEGRGRSSESPRAAGAEGLAWLWQPLRQLLREHAAGLRYRLPQLWALLGGGTVLMLLGLADDRYRLDWRLRLAVQTVVAIFLVSLGWQITLYSEARWLTAGLTVLWIVGLVNAFNMLDNMDGLSAGVAAIASILLVAALLISPAEDFRPQLFVAGLLLVLLGALAGFLWHNRPPARLFMGDAGSYFVGYCVAAATIMATYTRDRLPTHAILTPLCVLAVPLYDACTVVCIRLRERRSPFEGDKSHLSHRLVELGMSKGQAVLTIYLLTATCGLGALVLNQVNEAGAWVILTLVGCVLLLVGILETSGRRGRNGDR